MPTLSVGGLLYARRVVGKGGVVHTHSYSPGLKVLIRWLRVPPEAVCGALSRTFGLRIERSMPEGRSGSTPAVSLDAQRRTTSLTDALSEHIERSGWTARLAELIGAREASAFMHRQFSWDSVYLQVLSVIASHRETPGPGPLPVLWSPTWPDAWLDIVERTFEPERVRLVRWPGWYKRVHGVAASAAGIGPAVAVILNACLRRSRRDTNTPDSSARILTEVIDEGRMGATSADANWLEDGERLRRDDILYFLTKDHSASLRRRGRNPAELLEHLRGRGFKVIETRRQRHSQKSKQALVRFTSGLIRGWRPGDAPCLGHTFWSGVSRYVELRALFDNAAPRVALHTNYPNGPTGIRFDSAIVSGICRQSAARCVGYQNRIIYEPVYEDSYDCYDVFLAWGQAWPRTLGAGLRFVDRVAEVGSLNNQGLVPRDREHSDRLIVTIFTTEWRSAYSLPETTVRLLLACVRLARRHPSCEFRIKTKDPEIIKMILGDDTFRSAAPTLPENFVFLERKRHDCATAIAESDIVIAAAFTTPGADALLLGRRVLFYSEIANWGAPFARLPDLIATGPDELERLFEVAIDDHAEYAKTNAERLNELDPFRDGRARSRALDVLFEEMKHRATERTGTT